MSNTLKNPFFIAIAAAVAIGTACALLLGPNTKDAGQAFVVGGTFMLFALIPTMLIAFLVIVVQRQSAKVKAEQVRIPAKWTTGSGRNRPPVPGHVDQAAGAALDRTSYC